MKDVDGFHPENIGNMVLNVPGFLPATHAELESNAYLNTDKLEQILATHNNIEECVIYNLKEEIVWRINSDIFRQYPHIHFRIEDNMFRDLGHALPDNVVHFKHPFYFLYHTMTHGLEYDANVKTATAPQAHYSQGAATRTCR